MTKTGTVGIVVSAEPIPFNSQSAAFAQGVKAEKPDTKILYAVIGPAAYSDAAGGRRVTETVIGAGADVIFGQGDGSSFGMLQATETTKSAKGTRSGSSTSLATSRRSIKAPFCPQSSGTLFLSIAPWSRI